MREGLRRTFADAHRRYTEFINARHRWTGHLWQGRFGAVVMDEAHLAHAYALRVAQSGAREAGPAPRGCAGRASRLISTGQGRTWSRVAPALERYGDFAAFLGDAGGAEQAWRSLRQSETSGRPLGDADWVAELEARSGQDPPRREARPKPRVSCI